jgi:hypothetical protein
MFSDFVRFIVGLIHRNNETAFVGIIHPLSLSLSNISQETPFPSLPTTHSQTKLQLPLRPPIPPLIKPNSPGHLSPIQQSQAREMVARPRVQSPFARRRAVFCGLGRAPRFHALGPGGVELMLLLLPSVRRR